MSTCKASVPSIDLQEGDLRVKVLDSVKRRYQAYRLRKKIYCDELRWVPGDNAEIEVDAYDADAILIGALDEHDKVVGTVRIISALRPMMIEKEFISLIAPSHQIKKEKNAAEISRLGVCKSMRARKRAKVSHALYQSIHRWSMLHKVRYLYMVVEQKMLRNLNLTGFPCQQIGPVLTLHGGYDTAAALLDWHDFDCMAKTTQPAVPSALNRYNSVSIH